MEFANTYWLLLLLLLIPYVVWRLRFRKHEEAAIRMSDLWLLKGAPKTMRQRLLWVPEVLRGLTFVLIVICMARPQTHTGWGEKNVEGIDIMLAMDVSTTMMAKDLTPNRIEAAKSVAQEFIADRENDNIGMTIFAGEAFTQCPMTTDHGALTTLMKDVSCDLTAHGLIQDGTAIGMGLANAISRLEDSKAKSKVVILLTDGNNNMGDISPSTAADIAKSLGVRIYTIGVGTRGIAKYPIPVAGGYQDINMQVDIDEATLRDIASTTGGKYYRATNSQELSQIYKDIDNLERSKIDVKTFSKTYEAYQPFMAAAIISLLLEVLLRMTYFRRKP